MAVNDVSHAGDANVTDELRDQVSSASGMKRAGDTEPELWATEILRHSTGIAVWEHGGARYEKVYSAFPLCGD